VLAAMLPLGAGAARAQCGMCAGTLNQNAYRCGVDETVCRMVGINTPDPSNPAECDSGCSFVNCRVPEVTGPTIVPVPTPDGKITARLTMDVRSVWNAVAGDSSSGSRYYNPNGTLDMIWYESATVPSLCDPPVPATQCDWFDTDHATCYLEVAGLTCTGAPYDFGVVSFRAQTCGGPEALCGFPSRCGRAADFPGLSFTVTKQDLGCPIPPTEACNGDSTASCEECLAGGVGIGGGGPGAGGSRAPGNPAAGGGAYLYYAAGGAGHAGLPGSASWNATLGRHWSHSYAERIVVDPDESHVWLVTRYATFREWGAPDPGTGVYQTVSPSNEVRTLTWTGNGWTLEELDGAVHAFDGGGLWLSTTDRNGNAKTATYSGGVLAQVHFPDGRREDFSYYPAGDLSEGKLRTITEVGVDGATSHIWTYAWSGDDLTRVDRPDGTAIVYTYGDGRFPGYLTRIKLEGTDGTSRRVERAYEYDGEGNVTASWAGDVSKAAPDAVDLWQLAFDDPVEPTVTTVTDPLGPLGQPITYQLGRDTVSSNTKVLSISGDCPVCGLGPNTTMIYEDSMHPGHPLLPKRILDGRGNETYLVYTDHGQVKSRTEAANVAPGTHPHLPRTTSWTYDSVYPGLVTSIETPSVVGGASLRTTEWLRGDAPHNPTSRRITGVESGSAFVYDTVTGFNGAGQPLTIDPPGHGTADVTTWSYTPPAPGEPDRGELFPFTRTDPLVGDTAFGYDPFNRRTSVVDPNGVETRTVYDPLDRVTEVRQVGASPPADDLATGYEYTVFGDLFRTILPEGNVIEYGYDTAGRLISVERKPDALPESHGERTFYTLDAAGNRTLEELQRWDADAAAWVTVAATEYQYSNRCQVDRVIQAPGTPEEAITEHAYDCNGNLSQVWDPNHPRFDPVTGAELPETALYLYDAVDRLTSVTQPWGGAGGGFTTTSYEYDVQDHLVGVTDAEGNATTYTYSDRDLLTHELVQAFVDPSATCNPAPACDPGCGCTAHTYDEHGALDTTLDARGVLVDRTVDPLDRVTDVDYPGTALDVSYSYDTGPAVCATTSFELGRLGSVTRNGQVVDYCYDRFGRVTRDGELALGYDRNGNRTVIAYPGGVSATYGHDFADRQVSLSVTTPGGTEPVVTAASYLPSRPLSTLVLGSGTTENLTMEWAFDGRYAPTEIGISGAPSVPAAPGGIDNHTWSYTTDRVGNVLEIVERSVCLADPVVLGGQTVTTTQTFTSCSDLEAGSGFAVESPGDVTFEAQGSVILGNGFSVGSGARFQAGSGGAPELSRRTYAYQDVQYFLTGAAGPWPEDLAWTYDAIGNRLTETRDAGTLQTDTYIYAPNAATGNTPILDQVTLGVGGTRDYTWGAAGHLEEVGTMANPVDLVWDAAGRLASADRTAASQTAGFTYDGRSFLMRAEQTAGGTASVSPVYDSSGLLHVLERQASPSEPIERTYHLYLAGRPVAQLAVGGTGTETWTYLTTDHLGTPLLATDATGAVVWEGGFEPFGRDWQAGLPDGASENGIYLRLPGQWDDGTWGDATSGAGVYQNVWRWYQPATGRYTRPDPIHLGILESATRPQNLPLDALDAYYLAILRTGNPVHEHPYLYGARNPLLYYDPLGLFGAGTLAMAGGACIAGDGPFPFGDVVGVPLLIVAGGWAATEVITDWWSHREDCDDCDTDPCDAQYQADSEICRRHSTSRLRALCWRRAALRYSNCIAGRPVPDLFPLE